VKGRVLLLGGVRVEHETGLSGHSDGDVLIHAIIDAILGACALGDIGRHFPDDDPEFEGVASSELLSRVQERLATMGRLEHVDTTVVAERPRLSPHIDAMRERISAILKIPIDKISVKAKTAEGLGPVGKGEAIEAYAVATVDL
jgi:2-C-methyl-D-erythritol 2,4-cyclodiphosphate synthase